MNNQIWMQEPHDFAVCRYCRNQMFGKAYRKWKNPKLIGENIIYEKTDIKICGICYHNLIKAEHEERSYLYFKRRRFKKIRIGLSCWKNRKSLAKYKTVTVI